MRSSSTTARVVITAGEGEKQQHYGKSDDHCWVPVAERETEVEIRFEMGLLSAASEPDPVRTGFVTLICLVEKIGLNKIIIIIIIRLL